MDPRTLAERVGPVMDEARLGKNDRFSLESIVKEVSSGTMRAGSMREAVQAWEVLSNCLSRSTTATAMANVVLALSVEPNDLAVELRKLVRMWCQRRPAGERVLMLAPFPDVKDDERS